MSGWAETVGLIGDAQIRLPNGALVMSYRKMLSEAVWVVLARWVRNSKNEYVCWKVDKKGDAYWGHYFDNFDDAFDYFMARR